MALIYAGIDEAGYGPLLGPLVVACTVWRIRDWKPGDPRPDLWRELADAVAPCLKDARGRLVVADSKQLKGRGGAGRELRYLELGVLAHLAATGVEVEQDDELFGALGASLEERAWYHGAALPAAQGCEAGERRIAANCLKRAMAARGIELLAIRGVAICEAEFNRLVAQHGGKGATTALTVARLIAGVQRRWGGSEPIRVACDRLGGRLSYREILSAACPGLAVEIEEESAERCRYRIGGGALGVAFQPEAEKAHYPVALASMAAKLVRELAMARFNRYWCGIAPEVKPTAGYRQDAGRWLRDMAPQLSEHDRAAMVRLA